MRGWQGQEVSKRLESVTKARGLRTHRGYGVHISARVDSPTLALLLEEADDRQLLLLVNHETLLDGVDVGVLHTP